MKTVAAILLWLIVVAFYYPMFLWLTAKAAMFWTLVFAGVEPSAGNWLDMTQ